MTDIVERLRLGAVSDGVSWSICKEAADEIERLNGKLANRDLLRDMAEKEIERLKRDLRDQCELYNHDAALWHDEIEHLRAALDDCIHGRRDWMEKAKHALEGK